jgi:hypothetical protein
MRIKLLCIGLSALAFAAGAFARDAPFHKLTLYVANQSFNVNPVDVKVTIDGVKVAEGIFFAGYGRSWRRYDVRLAPGRHVLRALTRKGGAALKREFTVTGPRWAAVAYRNRLPSYGTGAVRHFAFAIRDRPFGEK